MRVVIGCLILVCLPGLAAAETIFIEAEYPGASAAVVAETVTGPLEQALHGLKDAKRVASLSRVGRCLIWVDLKDKVDARAVHVQAQNRLADAAIMLPEEVRLFGVSCRLLGERAFTIVMLHSTRYDLLYLARLATLQIVPALDKAAGVRHVHVATEISLDLRPDAAKLEAHDLTLRDLLDAIRPLSVGAGRIGAPPVPPGDPKPVDKGPRKPVDRETLLGLPVAKRGGKIVTLGEVAAVDAHSQSMAGIVLRGEDAPVLMLVVEAAGGPDVRNAVNKLRKELPDEVNLSHHLPGKDDFFIHLRLPAGAVVERSNKVARDAAKAVAGLGEVEVRWLATGNQATLILGSTDAKARKAILPLLHKTVLTANVWVSKPRPLHEARPGEGADIVVRLEAKDERVLLQGAEEISASINKLKGVAAGVEPEGRPVPALTVTVNRERATTLGVGLRDVLEALPGGASGFPLPGGFTLHLAPSTPGEWRDVRDELARRKVKNADGKLVRLQELVDIHDTEERAEIYRENGKARLLVCCTLQGAPRENVLGSIRKLVDALPVGVTATFE